MKNLFLLVGIVLLASCGTAKRSSITDSTLPGQSPEGLKAEVVMPQEDPKTATNETSGKGFKSLEFTDSVRVKELVEFLASDQLEGRESGSKGIEAAANFIDSIFVNNGVEKYFNSYRDTLTTTVAPSYNMVGVVRGQDPELSKEFIIIGAHYDHIGKISSGTLDSIANGANDNASGTATVLELARFFGQKRSNKRSLLFVLFSAEEKGLLGSSHLAQRLNEEGFNLYTMLNFEMTGVPMEADFLLYLSGYELSNLADVCNTYAGENLVGFLPQAKQYQLFQRSDNYPFHKLFNVPSQTYCTFDFTNYAYYHKVGDEASELDYMHMARVVNKMIPVIEGIANAQEKEIKYH